jgi:glutathione S-transferase
MYTVIGSPKTRAIRVIWMLEELGAPYTINPVMPHDPQANALNPSGKIPILQDGSDTVCDSVAILQYLADKHGMMTSAAGTIQRAHQDSWVQFASHDVEFGLWTAAKHKFVLPTELRLPDIKAACIYDFDQAMTAFSKRLGDKTYVMGDTFTVPDIILGHCAGWAKSIGWTMPEGNVGEYFARVRARPAALRAFATQK